jgi:hypothetical protein
MIKEDVSKVNQSVIASGALPELPFRQAEKQSY